MKVVPPTFQKKINEIRFHFKKKQLFTEILQRQSISVNQQAIDIISSSGLTILMIVRNFYLKVFIT